MPPDIVYELPPAGIFFSVLAVTGLLAFILHRIAASVRLKRLNEQMADVSPAVITLTGTFLALSVTFLANSVWQMEDRARESVYSEARSLRVMQTYIDAMTGPSRDGFSRLLNDYGRAVAAEWPRLREPDARAGGEKALGEIYTAVISGFAEGEQNRLLQQRLLVALDTLSAARQQRISMAQDVISAGQWFLVTALSLLLLAVIALSHGRYRAARRAALVIATLAISIAVYVIIAHDRPFVGAMAVSPQPILRATGHSG